jgi:dTDP-4-amino-4,6-dideoxygalactose transaminase
MMNSHTDKKRIRLFVPTFDIERCLDEIRECLEIGWTGAGYKTQIFEEKWSAYSGFRNSVFLSSNSVGLEIALKTLRFVNSWDDKSEILTTPLTFVATNHAILQAGMKPVFCDIDSSLCISVESILKNLTPNTKAIMFVGIGGRVGSLSKILDICLQRGIKVILDAAHMAGTFLQENVDLEKIDFAIYSFQAVKNLPTADSGIICTNNSELLQIAKKMSWLGIDAGTYERSAKAGGYKWMYNVDHIGLKANGNAIMASLGLAQLDRLDSDNSRRREIVKLYLAELGQVPDIDFPMGTDDLNSSCHLAQIIVKDREGLINFLSEAGIDTGVHYRLNTHYPMYSNQNSAITYAEEVEGKLLSLPIHMRLSDDDVKFVSSKIREYFQAK